MFGERTHRTPTESQFPLQTWLWLHVQDKRSPKNLILPSSWETSITHLISGVSDLLNTSDASLRDWMCRRDTTEQRNAVLRVGDSKALAETDPSLVSLLSALQYHIMPCNTLQCHGIPCNTRQTHHWCQSSQACPSMPKRHPHVHAPAIILNRWPVRAHKRGRQDAAKDPQIVLQYIC